MDLPDVPPDAALMKVEVAGVCGTDVSQYKLPLRGAPLIMGHENVGYLAKVGSDVRAAQGSQGGRPVFLEHYLPCGHCEWDHMGEYRHCAATEWFYDPNAIRYGYTSIDIAAGAVGRLQPLRLPAAQRRAPPRARRPVARGSRHRDADVQRHSVDADGRRRRLRVDGAHSGPGQQGLCCVMAAKQAGADRIIVTGTSRDARRLEVAKALGADAVIDVQKEDPLARILEITGGRGVDVVIDCTAGAGTAPTLLGIEATKRRGGTMVVQGEGNATFPDFPDRPAHPERHDAEERARPFLPRGGARAAAPGVAPVSAGADDDASLRRWRRSTTPSSRSAAKARPAPFTSR